jgi:UV excision repair protein RAD23
MKVLVKTLQQQQFELEVSGTSTVGQVKEQIQAGHGHVAAHQKLIHAGKVMENGNTLDSYGVKEGEFLVLMVRKPRTPKKSEGAAATASAPAAAAAAPEEKKDDAEMAEAKPAEPQQQQQQQQPPAAEETKPADSPAAAEPAATATAPGTGDDTPATATETPAAGDDGNSLVTGTAYEAMVKQLQDMGFPEDQVKLALRAAFNNPDRAVEYLMSGIPDMPPEAAPAVAQPPVAQPPTATGAEPMQQASPTPGTEQPAAAPATGEDAGNFDFLREMPQFDQLRQMVLTNPQLLEPVLQQLGESNPELLQKISENQAEFLRMLHEPIPGGDDAPPGGPGVPGMPGGVPQTGGPPGGQQYIQVTPDEKAAIERLEAMGFDRGMVLQAYFACDKDENAAANWLFENGD